PPGRTYTGTYSGDSTNTYLDLTKLSAPGVVPTPLPSGVAPMTPIPITDRSQNITFFDQNYVSPYVQNLTLSITHAVTNKLSVDLRYIGTLARKQYTSFNLNSNNFLYNGLLTEFDKIRSGGESAVLDNMLRGINICTSGCAAGASYGAIGQTVNGVPQTAALQLRSNSTFTANLANGNYSAVAGSLNTLDYTKSGSPAAGINGNCNLPDINTSVIKGAVLRVNGNPENFIATNPQFANANYFSNAGNSNYHSFQAEVVLRPVHGFSGTANYTFSKNLGLPCAACSPTGFTNPVDRHGDYSVINTSHPHILRTNGDIELPIGPGKALFGNSSGVVARVIEGWRLG